MAEAPAPVSQISLIIHTLIIDVVINIDLFYVKVRITNNHILKKIFIDAFSGKGKDKATCTHTN